MFIKKIFENKVDEAVHRQFVRFGKGRFDKRAIINVKRDGKIALTASFELVNDLVAFVADLAGWFRVQGIVLSKQPLELEEKPRKKQGLFSYEIAKEIGSDELSELASKSYATLLDCLSPEGKIDLKIKKKLPVPRRGELRIDEKFCQLSLDSSYWPQLHDALLWELPRELKKARLEHSFIISNIVTKGLEGKPPEEIRQEAKRAGKLIRKAVVDSKEFVSEKEFIV